MGIDFSAESPENYEQKSICCFVVDVSGSMGGNPIDALNRGLQEFHRDISENSITSSRLEIAIVEFSSSVATVLEPSLAESFRMPTLTVKGSTCLVDGVREGIKLVEARKNWYKETGQPYLRPWIVLITDGEPDRDQDVDGLSREIKSGVDGKNFVFMAIGVEDANMALLKQIYESPLTPKYLEGLKFSEFFEWMSASMAVVSGSKDGDTVDLPEANDWTKGFRI